MTASNHSIVSSNGERHSLTPPARRVDWRYDATALALIALCLLPTLSFGWVYDDGWTLLSNGFLRVFDPTLLFSPRGVELGIPDVFRPTLVAFDALAYVFFGVRAPWHHGLSIALHLVNCALLARVARALGQSFAAASIAMLAFGLLAVHAEPIAVVSFREDLLATGLGLTCLLAALASEKARGKSRWASLMSCAVLSALAYGAKQNAAMLAPLWCLICWISPWRPRPTMKSWGWATLAISAGTALGVLQNLAVLGHFSPYATPDHPRVLANIVGYGATLARSLFIHLRYWQQMLAPFGLSPEYFERAATWLEWSTIFGAAWLCASCLGGWLARKRWPALTLTVWGTWLLMVPTSNLWALPNLQADRYLYWPSAVFCWGIGDALFALGQRLAQRRTDSRWLLAPTMVWTLVQGSALVGQTRVYASNATLWHVAVRQAPESARAQAAVGIVELSGRATSLDSAQVQAIAQRCTHAQTLDPLADLPELCLARLAIATRSWSLAAHHLARALDKSPDRNDGTLTMLAQVERDRTDLPIGERGIRSRYWLARGLRQYPFSPDLQLCAAHLAHEQGAPETALYHLEKAMRLHPERWQTAHLAIEVHLDRGDLASAQALWHTWYERLAAVAPELADQMQRRLALAARLHPQLAAKN